MKYRKQDNIIYPKSFKRKTTSLWMKLFCVQVVILTIVGLIIPLFLVRIIK